MELKIFKNVVSFYSSSLGWVFRLYDAKGYMTACIKKDAGKKIEFWKDERKEIFSGEWKTMKMINGKLVYVKAKKVTEKELQERRQKLIAKYKRMKGEQK